MGECLRCRSGGVDSCLSVETRFRVNELGHFAAAGVFSFNGLKRFPYAQGISIFFLYLHFRQLTTLYSEQLE